MCDLFLYWNLKTTTPPHTAEHHLLDTPTHHSVLQNIYTWFRTEWVFLSTSVLPVFCVLIHTLAQKLSAHICSYSHCCCQRGSNSFINICLASFWCDHKAVDAVFFHWNKHNTVINEWSLMQTEFFKWNQTLINTVISPALGHDKVVLEQT